MVLALRGRRCTVHHVVEQLINKNDADCHLSGHAQQKVHELYVPSIPKSVVLLSNITQIPFLLEKNLLFNFIILSLNFLFEIVQRLLEVSILIISLILTCLSSSTNNQPEYLLVIN